MSQPKRRPEHIGNLVPFSVIRAATKGDVDAIGLVLKYYKPYISKLALHPVYDEAGNLQWVVDEYMFRRLETKLITTILKFKIA